jgi:hypothetical protein
MKLIRDCFGRSVRLTDERLGHILEHSEMVGMEDELERIFKPRAMYGYRIPTIV